MYKPSGELSSPQAATVLEPLKNVPETKHPIQSEEGVFLLQSGADRRRTLENIDIRKRLVGSRVGRTALLKVEGEFSNDHEGVVLHQLIGLELDGQRHAAWITEPTSGVDANFNLVRFPGLGEDIEGDIGYKHHVGLAREFPEARTITVANNGTGRFGYKHLQGNSGFSIKQMANERYELTSALVGTEPVIGVSTSMGTVIQNEVSMLNINDADKLQIKGNCYFAPAHVLPNKTMIDMALKFIPGMTLDGIKEFFKTPVDKKIEFIKVLSDSLRHTRANLGALATQAAHLIEGCSLENIELVIDHYPTAVIVGSKDPVGQIKMWRGLESNHPNLSIHEVHGRGHAITLKPENAVRKIAKTLRLREFVAGSL